MGNIFYAWRLCLDWVFCANLLQLFRYISLFPKLEYFLLFGGKFQGKFARPLHLICRAPVCYNLIVLPVLDQLIQLFKLPIALIMYVTKFKIFWNFEEAHIWFFVKASIPFQLAFAIEHFMNLFIKILVVLCRWCPLLFTLRIPVLKTRFFNLRQKWIHHRFLWN